MPAVTWRELPADAPEPGDHVIVRDKSLCRWACIDGRWLPLLDSVDSRTDLSPWRVIVEQYGPMQVPEDADAYAPWPAPGELIVEPVEPSDYEIRHAALAAAASFSGNRPVEWTPEVVVEAARVFEPYLRGEGGA